MLELCDTATMPLEANRRIRDEAIDALTLSGRIEVNDRVDFFRLPPQLPSDAGKLTVVLDVDETLVHTFNLTENSSINPNDYPGSFTLNVGKSVLLVHRRPFLDEFLREASKRFELVAFTAGSEDYAGPLLDALDPTGTVFRHRLFRHHCISKSGKDYVKDLEIINRDLTRTVLVDNNPLSFLLQLNNGVPIAPFIDDLTDKALVTLFDFLVGLSSEADVRQILKSIFNMESMFRGYSESSIISPKSSSTEAI